MRRLQFSAVLFASLLAVTNAHAQVADILGLLDLGLGFLAERKDLRGNKCLTTQEADGRNQHAFGILGAVTGAVVAPTVTGRPMDMFSGAGAGGVLGAWGARSMVPKADAAPSDVGRNYDYVVCQQIQNGQRQRQPIVLRLIDQVGPQCQVPRKQFSPNPENGPDAAWRQLLTCAKRDPKLQALVSNYFQQLGSVNYSTCLAAKSEVELMDSRVRDQALASGASAMPHPTPFCTRDSPEQAWKGLY